MIEKNSPVLSVDELMVKVRERIDASPTASLLRGPLNGHALLDVPTLAAGIENDLAAADAFSQVRTSLGSRVRFRGPFVALQSFLLRGLAFAFRDQRNVNAALSRAIRKSLQLSVHTLEKCEYLSARVAELEAKKQRRKA